MILEILLIAAIIGIFVIVARRLPEALREGQEQPVSSASDSPRGEAGRHPSRDGSAGKPASEPKQPGFLARFFAKSSGEMATSTPGTAPTQTAPTPAPSKVSDESLLAEGDQFLNDGKLREAERAFLRAVAKNPKNPKLYNRLGAIYLKQRNFSDALEAFVAARDLDSSKASRHYNVALAAWQSGKRPLAREAIAEALSLDPTAEKYLQLKKEIEG
ncbi:tetratricopeptide repeat protein [Candidatus Berkelbacteria bacterium]|nr:tetratricopeptide repeat protein [Candidatus Berkelbacteria bacterium]